MELLYSALGWIMNGCYAFCHNYGVAIILFTLISKIVLLPVSVWVQKNSIKMVKMQPEINFLNANHYGDKDTIADEQAKIFKREKYNPMASVVPLIIQLVLLAGVVEVIKRGMNNPAIDMSFLKVNMSLVPSGNGMKLILSPIIAGLSSYILCVAQNASNVLQSQQSKINKYGMLLFSVGLSVYLGWFVPVGVAVYWTASNLMAVAQLYILNYFIDPRKYVDYQKLEESKKALDEIAAIGGTKKRKFNDPQAKRERADYKRFFSIVNKHLVFYSESSGFYKYFKGIIEYILENTNIVIHYITSDPQDNIFKMSEENPQIKAYYIGEKKLITLMMKMDADVVVMTMPDLDNYHIKRSYVRKDIEYIFIPHSMDSLNMTMRTASMDHFDTVFCTGKHQREEAEKTEIAYNLPKRTLVDWGYCLLDEMRESYKEGLAAKKGGSTVKDSESLDPLDSSVADESEASVKTILVAPSWQKDNIVDSCLDELLENLKGHGFKVVVRPHPQHVRHMPERMEQLKARFAEDADVEIQTDFSSNSTVFEADMMITDWSGIAYEYAFTTCKPVLFIDTPMKIMNPEYQKIDTVPINIWMREEIGAVLKPEEMEKIAPLVLDMLSRSAEYYEKIDAFVHEYVYNLDNSSSVGAKYIISAVQRQTQARKKAEK